MDNNSVDRSKQVQDPENNNNEEQSPIPVSLERHRNKILWLISTQSDK